MVIVVGAVPRRQGPCEEHRHDLEVDQRAGLGGEGVIIGVGYCRWLEPEVADDVGGGDVEDCVGVHALEVGVGHDQGRERDRLGVGHRVMRSELFVGGRAIFAIGELDRFALAEERVVNGVVEGRAHRGARGHDVQDRLVGIGRAGIGRIVEVGVDAGVDPRADRSEGVAVLEAGEVAELVGGDGGRQADEVGARRGGLAGTAQEVIDVDPAGIGRDLHQARRVVSVVVPEMSRSRQSIALEMPPSRPTSTGSLKVIVVYGPDCGCVWVNV